MTSTPQATTSHQISRTTESNKIMRPAAGIFNEMDESHATNHSQHRTFSRAGSQDLKSWYALFKVRTFVWLLPGSRLRPFMCLVMILRHSPTPYGLEAGYCLASSAIRTREFSGPNQGQLLSTRSFRIYRATFQLLKLAEAREIGIGVAVTKNPYLYGKCPTAGFLLGTKPGE